MHALRARELAKQFPIQTRIILVCDLLGFVLVDDNVLKFPVKERIEEPKQDDIVMSFIQHSLLPWALDNDVNVESLKFKLNAAGVMACMQGMLLNDI